MKKVAKIVYWLEKWKEKDIQAFGQGGNHPTFTLKFYYPELMSTVYDLRKLLNQDLEKTISSEKKIMQWQWIAAAQ